MRKRTFFIMIAVVIISAILVVISVDKNISADERAEKTSQRSMLTAAQDTRDTSESRRVIVSMGEKSDEMFITWTGDKDGPRLIRYSADKSDLPKVVPVRAQRTKVLKGYRYKAGLTDLEAGSTYYYQIGDGTVYDSSRFFSTPDDDETDVFAYLGDPQFDKSVKDYEAWGRLTKDMYSRNTDIEFTVMGGDMVNIPTSEAHWRGFLDNSGLFSMIPLMTIPGNHEGVTSNNTYKKMFHHVDNGPEGEAFYWFESEQCRFLMLDSSFLTKARRVTMGEADWSAKEREVERWLAKCLEESRKSWNIVVVHHPAYGLHDMFTVSKEIRELWLPIMEAGGVDLVLCGHQHVYMRTQEIDGIVHIMGVSGAKRSKYYRGSNEPVYSRSIYGAGPNYQVFRAREDKLEIFSYNEKGSIIDAAHIDKGINPPYFQTFW